MVAYAQIMIRSPTFALCAAAPLIEMLSTETCYKQRAIEFGQLIKTDDGAENASYVIENILATHAPERQRTSPVLG